MMNDKDFKETRRKAERVTDKWLRRIANKKHSYLYVAGLFLAGYFSCYFIHELVWLVLR